VRSLSTILWFAIVCTVQVLALLPFAEISPEALYVDLQFRRCNASGELNTWLISDVGGYGYCIIDTGEYMTVEYIGRLEPHVLKDVKLSIPSNMEQITFYFLVLKSRIEERASFSDALIFMVKLGREIADARVLKRAKIRIRRENGLVIEKMLDEKVKKAQLFIISSPGVNVYVNASHVGTTDETGTLLVNDLRISRIRLKFESADYITRRLDLQLRAGLNFLKIDLERAAILRISSNVYPLKVFYDNRLIGLVESREMLLKIPAGRSRLRLENPEVFTKVVDVDMSPGEEKELDISMMYLPFMIKIVPRFRKNSLDSWVDVNIVSSRSCEATLTVHEDEKVLWTKREKVVAGINSFKWCGEGSNGLSFPASITFKVIGKTKEGGLATSTAILSVARLRRNSLALLSILSIGALLFFVCVLTSR